jgi:hypothetical protein
LIISMGPSTLSMVPRMRTIAGCCAHAVDPTTSMAASDAMMRRDIDEEILQMLDMTVPL